jgi:hypothetical protein
MTTRTVEIGMTPFNKDFVNFIFSPTTTHANRRDVVEFELSPALRTRNVVVRIHFPYVSPFDDEISFTTVSKGKARGKFMGTSVARVTGGKGTYHYYVAMYVDGQLFVDADCPTLIVH